MQFLRLEYTGWDMGQQSGDILMIRWYDSGEIRYSFVRNTGNGDFTMKEQEAAMIIATLAETHSRDEVRAMMLDALRTMNLRHVEEDDETVVRMHEQDCWIRLAGYYNTSVGE